MDEPMMFNNESFGYFDCCNRVWCNGYHDLGWVGVKVEVING